VSHCADKVESTLGDPNTLGRVRQALVVNPAASGGAGSNLIVCAIHGAMSHTAGHE